MHGDRPPLGVGQHTVDDDRAAGLAVAVGAEAGQRAGLPLVVAAGDVVEHHRPFAEVLAGELFLDGPLPQEQPVHGVVEVILSGVDDIQLLGQSGAVPVAGMGQLGAGKSRRSAIMATTRSRCRERFDVMSSSTPSLRIIVSTAST